MVKYEDCEFVIEQRNREKIEILFQFYGVCHIIRPPLQYMQNYGNRILSDFN